MSLISKSRSDKKNDRKWFELFVGEILKRKAASMHIVLIQAKFTKWMKEKAHELFSSSIYINRPRLHYNT